MSGGEAEARALDAEDPLRGLRERFLIPPSPAHDDGRACWRRTREWRVK